jgi:transcriptional regulator with XRE-family HTH domain
MCAMGSTTLRTAKLLLLGHEIRHMREQVGLSQAEAARLIEARQAKMADLEAGRAVITPGDLLLLAKGFGITDQDHIETLLELRRDNHKRGFWSTGYHRAYHEDFRLLVDMEQHADLIRSVEVEVMPGLAQCEAYVRAMFSGRANGEVTDEDMIKARLARQETTIGTEAPEYHVVMSESCLRREFGGTAVMREQLDHLIKLSKRPNVIFQVLPFKTRPAGQASISTRFWLVRLPSPGIAGPVEIAYTDADGDIRYLDDKKALQAHEKTWARLTAGALGPADSRKFVRDVARELRQ